jgi:hypothetical protein
MFNQNAGGKREGEAGPRSAGGSFALTGSGTSQADRYEYDWKKTSALVSLPILVYGATAGKHRFARRLQLIFGQGHGQIRDSLPAGGKAARIRRVNNHTRHEDAEQCDQQDVGDGAEPAPAKEVVTRHRREKDSKERSGMMDSGTHKNSTANGFCRRTSQIGEGDGLPKGGWDARIEAVALSQSSMEV